MAVKPKKIKERLMELFPKAKNLSKARMNVLTVALAKIPADDADDDAIDAVINDHNAVFNFEEIAKSDDTIRTLTKKLNEKKPGGNPGDEEEEEEEEDPKPGSKKPDEMPVWAKGLFQKLDSVSTELNSIKTGKVIENKMENAKSLFAKSDILKKLPEKVQQRFLKTLELDNEDLTIEDQIAELEEENEEFVQSLADSESVAGTPPANTSASKVSDEELTDIVGNM
jgi:predicted RND superfamily exporter protein